MVSPAAWGGRGGVPPPRSLPLRPGQQHTQEGEVVSPPWPVTLFLGEWGKGSGPLEPPLWALGRLPCWNLYLFDIYFEQLPPSPPPGSAAGPPGCSAPSGIGDLLKGPPLSPRVPYSIPSGVGAPEGLTFKR